MIVPDYTLVVGVDAFHLRQLALVWPTWKRHKPSLLQRPLLVFYESASTSDDRVRAVVDHPDLRTVGWPVRGLDWEQEKGEKGDKFQDPHRAMMLSGFVYAPSLYVETSHWLKLDTDVVATGVDDWIDPSWFEKEPAVVAHRWGFTRPADQMLKMDRWVEENRDRMPDEVRRSEPLNLVPLPGWDRVGHKRIISWCGLFDTRWTNRMALLTRQPDGSYKLPIPSQDGFLFYMAKRSGREVVRINAKGLGFSHWHTWNNVKKYAEEAMKQG